jgi:hypothetical protein
MLRILSGIDPGVMIAVSNVDQLFDGASVRTDGPANAASTKR